MRTQTQRILSVAVAVVSTASINAQAQYVYTTLAPPQAAGVFSAFGISGTNSVGYYEDSLGDVHGFLYNGMTSNNSLFSSSPPARK